MVTTCLTYDCKHFELVLKGLRHWQYLQDSLSKPNFRQKIISKILRTRTSNLFAASGDITGSRHRANCHLRRAGFEKSGGPNL